MARRTYWIDGREYTPETANAEFAMRAFEDYIYAFKLAAINYAENNLASKELARTWHESAVQLAEERRFVIGKNGPRDEKMDFAKNTLILNPDLINFEIAFQAWYWLNELAEKNDVDALLELSELLTEGNQYVEINFIRACQLKLRLKKILIPSNHSESPSSDPYLPAWKKFHTPETIEIMEKSFGISSHSYSKP
jgi:hypothetical protein